MVSVLPLVFNSPSFFSRPLGAVPKASTTIDLTVIFMFYNFFSFLTRSENLFTFSLSFIFTLWVTRMAKSTKLINMWSDLKAEIK